MTHYPALLIVSKDGYENTDATPAPHDVRDALTEQIKIATYN